MDAPNLPSHASRLHFKATSSGMLIEGEGPTLARQALAFRSAEGVGVSCLSELFIESGAVLFQTEFMGAERDTREQRVILGNAQSTVLLCGSEDVSGLTEVYGELLAHEGDAAATEAYRRALVLKVLREAAEPLRAARGNLRSSALAHLAPSDDAVVQSDD
jgi:hypothetical protein